MNAKGLTLALLAALGLTGCGPSGPPTTAANQPVVTTTPPLGPNAAASASIMGQPGAPPAFDRYGNANYNAQGQYVGAHGVGALVDNPDKPAPPPTASDIVRSEQQKVEDAVQCESIKASGGSC